MMKAIVVHQHGGSEKLTYEEVATPKAGSGELLIKVSAIGVNFIDVYHRTGLYPIDPPLTPGREVAGEIVEIGDGVDGFAVGDVVAYFGGTSGYAEYAVIGASGAVKVPGGISAETACAVFLQGMTAHYLAIDTYPLKSTDTCLIHAASGGVGLLLTQIAKKRGATVIGTVSTAEKEALARKAGADHIIRYTEADFAEETLKITGGKKLDVVYDSVGATTFDKSLSLLKPRGMMVLYGASSGPVPPFDLQRLNQQGSVYVTRPSLFHYVADRAELEARAKELFDWIASGALDVRIDQRFPLRDAKAAHDYLEARKTKGKILLIPEHEEEKVLHFNH